MPSGNLDLSLSSVWTRSFASHTSASPFSENNPFDLITVLRKERIKVPAGEFDAFVVKPVIKSNGLFSEKGDAEVWLADDRVHTLLKLKSKLPLGTLYLELRKIEHHN